MSNLSNDEFRLWDIFRKIEIKIGIELLEKKTRFKPEILKEWEGLASGFCNSIFYRLTGVWLQDHPCLITLRNMVEEFMHEDDVIFFDDRFFNEETKYME